MPLYWSVAGDQRPGRGIMGVAAFSKSFLVLDTSALEAGQIADMTALFDDVRGAELLPLNVAGRDPVRKTVDEGILSALGVDMDMRAIYRWVSGERQFHTSHTAVH